MATPHTESITEKLRSIANFTHPAIDRGHSADVSNSNGCFTVEFGGENSQSRCSIEEMVEALQRAGLIINSPPRQQGWSEDIKKGADFVVGDNVTASLSGGSHFLLSFTPPSALPASDLEQKLDVALAAAASNFLSVVMDKPLAELSGSQKKALLGALTEDMEMTPYLGREQSAGNGRQR